MLTSFVVVKHYFRLFLNLNWSDNSILVQHFFSLSNGCMFMEFGSAFSLVEMHNLLYQAFGLCAFGNGNKPWQ